MLEPGLECEDEFLVTEKHAVDFMGGPGVLSTPSMISMMEEVAWACVEDELPEGQTTVGVYVCVEHRRPAPVGSTVKVKARLTEIQGRLLTFHVEVRLGEDVVGVGEHRRFVIDKERFLASLR